MKHTATLLQKLFAFEFYKANISLFLIVLGFGVGFMKGEDHIFLAQLLVTSPTLLLIPLGVWVAYSMLVADFNLRASRRKENEFTYHFIFLPAADQWIHALQVVFVQLLPVTAYGAFLFAAGFRFDVWTSSVIVLLSITAITIGMTWLTRRTLMQSGYENRITWLSRWTSRHTTRLPYTFAIEWLLRKQPLVLIGTKVAGFLILWAALALYQTDTYDLRLLSLGVAIAISFHASLVCEWHLFDNVHFNLQRMLPITIVQRSVVLLLSFLLYFLPEIGLMIKLFPKGFSFVEWLGVILFLISIPYIAYGFLFLADISRYSTIHFFTTLLWVVVILSRVPPIIIAAINFSLGYFFWQKGYYSFEHIEKQEKT